MLTDALPRLIHDYPFASFAGLLVLSWSHVYSTLGKKYYRFLCHDLRSDSLPGIWVVTSEKCLLFLGLQTCYVPTQMHGDKVVLCSIAGGGETWMSSKDPTLRPGKIRDGKCFRWFAMKQSRTQVGFAWANMKICLRYIKLKAQNKV